MSPDGEQQFYDVQAAVAYLRSTGAGAATVSFVRGLICSGKVPHVRIGRRLYLSKAAIDAWLERAEKRQR